MSFSLSPVKLSNDHHQHQGQRHYRQRRLFRHPLGRGVGGGAHKGGTVAMTLAHRTAENGFSRDLDVLHCNLEAVLARSRSEKKNEMQFLEINLQKCQP